ncbi:pentatricopeptide repeat-containing protein At1g43980, mitochondrial isoform X1 [Macadamia integrifolia]|uniref:pentatricopeptide repeat-containing protein At1g43980, mitochondrial isoform X1 n=1 Tax=Macadamia integrifolia TaxID=60698 RepID=UPI001C4EACDB|nr:pentatricopeptide repeat-containing protein At1g43980, mitochondrial isoform X1 [Macadamia integrifolia]XP_042513655.1 pentatricopeptide repeat-containing protein At1g43980, mitochondrial isoform X1 [Macadamia integrifolia]XP_042513656.1 pentatricopeptide repeat-containing protein At1g43980, mitochondrial isoform X1 [Macadamia integrifolia]XP_042513657.1 pentatricopeptide repeat-containing protein At1g43980, mitochondrial isoform X1 [Macadamia integrifolia]XP_042513658.1 pentatricopeptide re
MIGHFRTLENKIISSLILSKNLFSNISQKISQDSETLPYFYSSLIDHYLQLKSLLLAKVIHAQLIKIGFNRHTFLGNRFLDLYSKLGTLNDALQVFDDIPNKNSFTWNILLMAFVKFGHLDNAKNVFYNMPNRDVVSWNSMISGYASKGLVESVLGVFSEMQRGVVEPTPFTFSIVMSCVWSSQHAKEIHGNIIRSGLCLSNIVLGNTLINMYGRLGLVEHAFSVFLMMEELDVISWNSLILGCDKSGFGDLALDQFCLMLSNGYSPDHFTMSMVISICSNLGCLVKGKQVFALCIKMGFLSNSIVLSATIDLFSKCNKVDDSVRLFTEVHRWNSTVCNTMISSYARHGLAEEALQLFVLTLREDVRPTEFTLSAILSSASFFFLAELGTQIHALVLKIGLEFDTIVACSLMDMYAKSGLVDSGMKIFLNMGIRDLVSWNTMLMGFAQNGRGVEALTLFEELIMSGLSPDRITLAGILLACSNGGFCDEGMRIFSSMLDKYRVIPLVEHYACMVEMMCRAGKLTKAMEMIETMPHEPSALVWGLLLRACGIHGDITVMERVAERMLELELQSSLPYLVLARIYGIKGRWESVARVRKAMKDRGVKKARGCSWIEIKNRVFVCNANHMLHCESKHIHAILALMFQDISIEGCVHREHDEVTKDGWEE